MSFLNLTGLAGVIFLCAGIFKYFDTKNFLKKASTADGTFTGYKEEVNIECPVYSYPLIKFAAKDGRTISFKGKNGEYYRSYKNGDTVSVVYLPENPSKAFIRSKINPLKESADKLVLGIILVLVSFI